MKSNKIRIALLGFGKWGRIIFSNRDSIDGIEMPVVFSRSGTPSESFQNVKFYRELDEVISKFRTEYDAWIIATPPESHAFYLEAAFRNDIPCLVEKPFVLRLEDMDRLEKVAQEKRPILQTNYLHLYAPAWSEMVKRIGGREIKSIVSSGGSHGPFRDQYSALWDYGSHDIAMILNLKKQYPSKIECAVTRRDLNLHKNAGNFHIRLTFPDGSTSETEVGTLFEKKKRTFKVSLENEEFEIDDTAASPLRRCVKGTWSEIPVSKDRSLSQSIAQFRNRILVNDRSFLEFELSSAVTKILDACDQRLD